MSPHSFPVRPALAGALALALVGAGLSPRPVSARGTPTVIGSDLIGRLASEMQSTHPALRGLGRMADSERLNAAATRTWADPEVQLLGAAYRLPFMAPEQGDVGYGVAQRLPLLGKEKAARQLADTAAEAAQARQQARVAELRRDLVLALLDAAARRVVLDRIGDDVGWLSTQSAVAETRVASGTESAALTLRLRNELDRRRTDWTNQAALHEDALVAVRRLLGRAQPGPDEPYALAPIGPSITLSPALVRRAEAVEPGIRRSDADVRVARSTVEVTRRSARPDVSLGVQAWHESATGNAAQGFFTLGVSIPWFNRDNYRRDLQRDRLRLDAAQDQLEDARQQVRRDLHALLTRIESARRDALLQRDTILPRTRQLEASIAAQWTSGRADLRDLLDTRRQRADAEINEAAASAAYWAGIAEVMLRCGLDTFDAAFSQEPPEAPVQAQAQPREQQRLQGQQHPQTKPPRRP